MGLVHQAHHDLWGIDIAIKHPRPEVVADGGHLHAFIEECETWAEIGMHPYIATCYYTSTLDGLPCVVAEFVGGGSLRDGIDNGSIYGDYHHVVLARLLKIAASSGWGLAHAHGQGLIHCDIKPGNLLLASDGIAKITDFGLARALGLEGGTGLENWSTPVYASPEQSRAEILSPATDAWSWAASILEMFAGEIFWSAGPACGAALEDFLDGGPKVGQLPPMPETIARLLAECLVFDPATRLSDFEQIASRVCDCYEQTFGETCPIAKPDLELVSADSLNNRAVSKHQTGDFGIAEALLAKALMIDPLHPEANMNRGILFYGRTGRVPEQILANLRTAAKYDLGNYRPVLFEACVLGMNRGFPDADSKFAQARNLASPAEILQINRIRQSLLGGELPLLLAPPISGEDFSMDLERFIRLATKAEQALKDDRIPEAERYLLMAGDIPGFGRHPRRRRLLAEMESQTKP